MPGVRHFMAAARQRRHQMAAQTRVVFGDENSHGGKMTWEEMVWKAPRWSDAAVHTRDQRTILVATRHIG